MSKPTALDWWTFWVGLVGSVATVAALVAAIVLGVHEVRALRRENAERDIDRRAEAVQRRRAQAECVSARVACTYSVQIRDPLSGQRNPEMYETCALVVNASSLPICDVTALVPAWGDPGKLERGEVPMVAGGASERAWVDDRRTQSIDGQPATVHFRDAAGVRWVRHRDGTLTEPRRRPKLDAGRADGGGNSSREPAGPQTR